MSREWDRLTGVIPGPLTPEQQADIDTWAREMQRIQAQAFNDLYRSMVIYGLKPEADMQLRQRTELCACTVGVNGPDLKAIQVASGEGLDALASKYGIIRQMPALAQIHDEILYEEPVDVPVSITVHISQVDPAILARNGVLMAEPTDAEREAAAIAKRQADCEYHRRGRKPFDTFVGKNPSVCAFCGITQAKYEKDNPA